MALVWEQILININKYFYLSCGFIIYLPGIGKGAFTSFNQIENDSDQKQEVIKLAMQSKAGKEKFLAVLNGKDG